MRICRSTANLVGVAILVFLALICAEGSAQERPAWVFKSAGLDGELLSATGVSEGAFVDERSAYFDALDNVMRFAGVEMQQSPKVMNPESAEVHIADVQKTISKAALVPGVICASMIKQYMASTEPKADAPSPSVEAEERLVNGPSGAMEYRQYFHEINEVTGTSSPTIISSSTFAIKCDITDQSALLNLLRVWAISDRYVERRADGRVRNFVRVKGPRTAIKTLVPEAVK